MKIQHISDSPAKTGRIRCPSPCEILTRPFDETAPPGWINRLPLQFTLRFGIRAILRDSGSRPLEESIAQGKCRRAYAALHGVFEIPDCRQDFAEVGRGVRIKGVFFGFDRTTHTDRPDRKVFPTRDRTFIPLDSDFPYYTVTVFHLPLLNNHRVNNPTNVSEIKIAQNTPEYFIPSTFAM